MSENTREHTLSREHVSQAFTHQEYGEHCTVDLGISATTESPEIFIIVDEELLNLDNHIVDIEQVNAYFTVSLETMLSNFIQRYRQMADVGDAAVLAAAFRYYAARLDILAEEDKARTRG